MGGLRSEKSYVRSKNIGVSGVEAWTRVVSEWFATNETGHGHSDELMWTQYAVDMYRSVPRLTTTVRASLQEAGLPYEWPETETTERCLVMNVDRCGGDQYRAVIDGLRPHCAQVAPNSETQGSAGQYDHRR